MCDSLHFGEEAYGTLQIALSVNCEGRIIAVRGVATALERELVRCVFAQLVKVRYQPPREEGFIVVTNLKFAGRCPREG